MLKKDVLKINDLVSYESDEHVDTISDSRKEVDASNEPIKETHIVNRVRNLSVGVRLFEPSVIGGHIQPVMNILDNLGVELSHNILSPLNRNTSKAFVIGSKFKSVGVNSNIINYMSPDRSQ